MSRPKPVELARKLRKNQTEAERRIWAKLRELRPDGLRFRRQHPIGSFIVDFACLEKKLVIELDGGQHNEAPNILMDAERTEWLRKEGYTVLRFWDNDAITDTDGVCTAIFAALGSPSSSFSPQGRSVISEGVSSA